MRRASACRVGWSADLYVTTEGGKPIPILAGETPGIIEDARHVMAQIRGLPGVTAVLGQMTWTLEPTVTDLELPPWSCAAA